MFVRSIAVGSVAAALTLTLTAAPRAEAAPITSLIPAAAPVAAASSKRPAYCADRHRHLSAHQRYMCRPDLARHLAHMAYVRRLAREARARKAAQHSARARVVAAAKRYIGQPYRYGGLDCSGLTQRAFRAGGVHLPRTSQAQARVGRNATGHARVGDLLVYRGAGHVAVVTGVRRGKVTDTIVARKSGTVVAHQRPYTAYTVRAVLP